MPSPVLGEAKGTAAHAGMVRVPAGSFLFGPRRDVRTLAEFWIDRDPVTNGDFARFARQTGATLPEHLRQAGFLDRKREHPVVGVSFAQALSFARHAGKDLPTEEEWEKAARGTDGRAYPWGENYVPGRCNASDSLRRDTVAVGSLPRGESPCGCHDLAGNVWEWTRTIAARSLYVVKGGSWYDPPIAVRADRRSSARPAFASASLGFRCVVRTEPLPPLPLEAHAPRTRLPRTEGDGEEWGHLVTDLRSEALRALPEGPEGFPALEFGCEELDAALERALTPLPAPETPAEPLPVPPPPARVRLSTSWSEVLVGLSVALGTFLGLRLLLG
jgi:sulfatase-modifying factor enzyme 1